MTETIKIISKSGRMPTYETEGSAGADLRAYLDEPVTLMPGERKLIPTGLAVAVPTGYGGFVFARSGLSSKYGVSLANCVGVIDSDYRGEVKISVINHSDEPYTVKNGERIAQLVIMPVDLCEYGLCDELDDTERGTGGFGSTGRM